MSSIVNDRCFFRLLIKPPAQIEESRALLIVISTIFYEICSPIMNLFGIAANTLSLVIYMKMGLTDSVTISFFALSFSDVCRSTPNIFAWFCEIFSIFACVNPNVSPLRSLAMYITTMFFDISALTIICISVQRCACVAFPLQVRGVFTRSRVTCFIAVIYVVVFSWYIPYFAEQRIEIGTDPVTNVTVFTVTITDALSNIMYVNFSVHVAGSIITQVVILICLVIFTNALIVSFRFRQQNSTPSAQKAIPLKELDSTNSTSTLPPSHPKQKHSSKETQIIKVVALTSSIFMFCQFPTLCISITHLFIPEFSQAREYQISYNTLLGIKGFFEYLNSDLNIFVYVACNSKFKETFYSTLDHCVIKATSNVKPKK